jgi:hypothetical protein
MAYIFKLKKSVHTSYHFWTIQNIYKPLEIPKKDSRGTLEHWKSKKIIELMKNIFGSF